MSEKWGSASNLRLDIGFDSNLDSYRLKELASEEEIERAKNIVVFENLDQKIRQDFCRRLKPIIDRHQDGIREDTNDSIASLFKNSDYSLVTNDIEIDYNNILIEHYVSGNESAEDILSEIESYDLKNESESFKAFIVDLGKLLNEYGFVVEDYNIEYQFNTRGRYN